MIHTLALCYNTEIWQREHEKEIFSHSFTMSPILNMRHRHKTEGATGSDKRRKKRFNSSTSLRGSFSTATPAVTPNKPFLNVSPQQGTGNSTPPWLFISRVPQGVVGEIFPFY